MLYRILTNEKINQEEKIITNIFLKHNYFFKIKFK